MLVLLFLAALACVLWNRRRPLEGNSDQRKMEFSSPLMIVCGDCAGDDIAPRKTFRNRLGRCATCGGASWAPASACGQRLSARWNDPRITDRVRPLIYGGGVEKPLRARAEFRNRLNRILSSPIQ